MKYILALAVALSLGCHGSLEEERAADAAEHKEVVTEMARTIALERYGSFTTVVCFVEYDRSTYSGYTDGQGDLQWFYPCLVFAPKYGWPETSERKTATIYCSDKSCQHGDN